MLDAGGGIGQFSAQLAALVTSLSLVSLSHLSFDFSFNLTVSTFDSSSLLLILSNSFIFAISFFNHSNLKGHRVVLCDVSPVMLERAREEFERVVCLVTLFFLLH